MLDKIYNRLEEEDLKAANYYNEKFGVFGINEKLIGTNSKKNLDLIKILNKIGLIEDNAENLGIIKDYYEYVFKIGIDMGISYGTKIVIDAIKKNKVDLKTIMETNPEQFVKYDFKPSFVSDMIDRIKNEK